jgi:hypothetical protein
MNFATLGSSISVRSLQSIEGANGLSLVGRAYKGSTVSLAEQQNLSSALSIRSVCRADTISVLDFVHI